MMIRFQSHHPPMPQNQPMKEIIVRLCISRTLIEERFVSVFVLYLRRRAEKGG